MLDRELRVWEDTFNFTFSVNTLSPFDTRDGHFRGLPSKQARSQEDEAFAIPYLQLMCNVCMFLIHLPALTFEPEVPQFSRSLTVCADSCRNIINIFGKNRSERRLFHLQPNGPRLIFQAALMCFYESWHAKAVAGAEQRSTQKKVSSDVPMTIIINTAIDLLELQICDYSATDPCGLQGQSCTSSEMLRSAIATLKVLAAQSVQDSEANTTGIMSASGIDLGESSQEEEVTNASGSEFWRPSFLGSLNQLDMLDWDFTSAPLDSNLINFSFTS